MTTGDRGVARASRCWVTCQEVGQRHIGPENREEAAQALGVTSRTVRRDWIKAKGWLATTLGGS